MSNTEGGAKVIVAEVHTSAAEDQEGGTLLANKDGELGRSELSTKAAPEPSRHQEPTTPVSTGEGAEVPPPPPPAPGRASTGWPDEMEEALTSSSIVEEHRALQGTALNSFRSTETGIREAFNGLFAYFLWCFSLTLILPSSP